MHIWGGRPRRGGGGLHPIVRKFRKWSITQIQTFQSFWISCSRCVIIIQSNCRCDQIGSNVINGHTAWLEPVRAWGVLSGHRDIYRYTIEISRYTPRRYLDIYRYAQPAPSLALSILIFQQLQAPPRLLCIEEKSYSNAMLLKHWKVFWLMRKTCKRQSSFSLILAF